MYELKTLTREESIDRKNKLITELTKRVEELEDCVRMIHCEEDSYDDEQTVLGRIFLKCDEVK